jgi:microsomal epoxide hydrolase
MPHPTPTPTPFRLHVADETLADLRGRLARSRFPEVPPQPPWSTGTSVAYMRDLVSYWHDRFDWRTAESNLNSLRQFKVPLAGIDLHFIHEEGKGPKPLPLLLSHGWPGSVIEFLKIIPMLTDPARFGGDPVDAFTVVAPSLPGYTLSFVPGQPRFGVVEMADVFASLMTNVLGYKKFGAQGGDWGGFIASRLGYAHPDKLTGIHVNLLAVRRDLTMLKSPTAEEKRYLAQLEHFLKEETGYQWIQGTKPTTLSSALPTLPSASPRGSPRNSIAGRRTRVRLKTRSAVTTCSQTSPSIG